MAMSQLTGRFSYQPFQVRRSILPGARRGFALIVKKELREPAKGLDYIGARSRRTEAGAESCLCAHTRKLRHIVGNSSHP